VGYARAGFEVTGVDIVQQPNYPFRFVHMDALGYMRNLLALGSIGYFDAIHASPPCQAYAGLAAKDGRHPKLIEPTRELLQSTGLPYVIENIENAKHALIDPIRLCGSTFGLHVRRHRMFETNWGARADMKCRHKEQGTIRAYYGKPGWIAWDPKGAKVQREGRKPLYRGSVEQAPKDMGIDWMTWDELREAIPPAYTHYLGHQLRSHLLTLHEYEAVAA
jgi:DNA (cytosine-5)-methyltransferase 1